MCFKKNDVLFYYGSYRYQKNRKSIDFLKYHSILDNINKNFFFILKKCAFVCLGFGSNYILAIVLTFNDIECAELGQKIRKYPSICYAIPPIISHRVKSNVF